RSRQSLDIARSKVWRLRLLVIAAMLGDSPCRRRRLAWDVVYATLILHRRPLLLLRALEDRVADGDFVVAVDEGGKVAARAFAGDEAVDVAEQVLGSVGVGFVMPAGVVGVLPGLGVE